MSAEERPSELDAKRFRLVLGHYPTGVTVVTAVPPDGQPVGLAIGSFTSVSLDPPLVAFLPDRSSTSWPRIREAGAFCVNVLSADQESVCRIFASKGTDKFSQVSWHPAGTGSPVIDGAVAWIDCDIDVIHEAGDHDIVIGRVRDLAVEEEKLPLVFFQGGYGRFAARSLAVVDDDLMSYLRICDLAVDRDGDAHRRAGGRVHGELGGGRGDHPPRGLRITRHVRRAAAWGARVPYAPPLGSVFTAWADEPTVESWLRQVPTDVEDSSVDALREVLAEVHDRGYSVGLALPPQRLLEAALAEIATKGGGTELRTSVRRLVAELTQHEYQPRLQPGERYRVSNIAAPVFGPSGRVVLALTLVGLPESMTVDDVQRHATRLLASTAAVSERVAAAFPIAR